jgi:hypothetical protein
MSDGFEKPSKAEDEYFVREELERRKRWAKERSEQMAAEEKASLQQLHHMKCPKCGMELHSMELHGVTVDQCTSCHGVWLDAGEVDHLLHPDRGGLFHRVLSTFRGE